MAALTWYSNKAETRVPLLNAVFWTVVVLTTIAFGLRLWIRRKYSRWQVDDYILTLAWLCLLGYSIVGKYAEGLGYGKHILDVGFKNLRPMQQAFNIAVVLTTVGIQAAKISFAVTMLKVTKNLWRWTNWLIWFIIISLILTAIPPIIFTWVICIPFLGNLIPRERCLDPAYSVRYGMFQGIYAAATDIILALLPWKILWPLQMRPVEKIGVGIAMSLGLVAGAMAITRSASLPQLMVQDVSYDGVIPILWTDIELGATIIAACIPMLRNIIYKEVTTRSNRSGGGKPNTDESKTPQQSNDSHPHSDSKSQSTTTTTTDVREFSKIDDIARPESVMYPKTPLTRWYTTPTPDISKRRRSDEDTFLRTGDTTPSEEGHIDQKLEMKTSRSDAGGDEGDAIPLTPWPESFHDRLG